MFLCDLQYCRSICIRGPRVNCHVWFLMQARGKLAYAKDAKESSDRIYKLPLQPHEFERFKGAFSPRPVKLKTMASCLQRGPSINKSLGLITGLIR